MSDPTPSDDERPEDAHLHGYAMPLAAAGGLLEALATNSERQRMSAEDAHHAIWHFVESLDGEQLHSLRGVLNLDSKSATNNYVDGIAAARMRYVLGLDPWTGKAPLDELAQRDPQPGS